MRYWMEKLHFFGEILRHRVQRSVKWNIHQIMQYRPMIQLFLLFEENDNQMNVKVGPNPIDWEHVTSRQ